MTIERKTGEARQAEIEVRIERQKRKLIRLNYELAAYEEKKSNRYFETFTTYVCKIFNNLNELMKKEIYNYQIPYIY